MRLPKFFRRSTVEPSVNPAGSNTVGLDHVAARGVGRPSANQRRLIFNFLDSQYHVEKWGIWREHMRDTYKLGRSRHKEIIVATPRDALMRFTSESDYNAVRGMMYDAGMYVSPFDTLTPEEVIDG